MIGDAAGMITPLCGNGMSMALHASKLAAEQIDLFLQDRITRQQMEQRLYTFMAATICKAIKNGKNNPAILWSYLADQFFCCNFQVFAAVCQFHGETNTRGSFLIKITVVWTVLKPELVSPFFSHDLTLSMQYTHSIT